MNESIGNKLNSIGTRIFVLEYSDDKDFQFSKLKKVRAKDDSINLSVLVSIKRKKDIEEDETLEVVLLKLDEEGEGKSITLNKIPLSNKRMEEEYDDDLISSQVYSHRRFKYDPYESEYMMKFNYINVNVIGNGTYCIMIIYKYKSNKNEERAKVMDVDYFEVEGCRD